MDLSAWCMEANERAADLHETPPPTDEAWYRIGDGYLCVQSADAGFRDRLALLFRDCAVAPPLTDGLPRVRCVVRARADDDVALVTFVDPEPLDQLAFCLELLPNRGYGTAASSVNGWSLLTLPVPAGRGVVAVGENRLLVHRGTPWQALVGSLATNRVFRLQRRLVALHAGSVGVAGQGVLILGPKGAGKTTLTLALAAQGHSFLGDELAGVRLESMAIVPIRRSLAVRDGPASPAVTSALDRQGAPGETFPDGTHRRRAFASDLFPAPVEALPLRRLVFLRSQGAVPRLEPMPPGRRVLQHLTPLGASLWGRTGAESMRDLIRVATAVPAFLLDLGPSDATATLLTNSLEH